MKDVVYLVKNNDLQQLKVGTGDAVAAVTNDMLQNTRT
jgi:hypothetical protein